MRTSGILACAALAAALLFGPSVRAEDIVVGTDASFKPFEYTEGDKYVGFDIDLWDAIAKDLGITYETKSMDFVGLIPALQTKNIDVLLAGLTIKEERKKVIDISDPYYESGLTALVRADETAIKTAADLAGKKIGARIGTATVDYLKKDMPSAQIELFQNTDNALLELQAGRVDAVIHDTPNMVFYAATVGKGIVKAIEEPIKGGDFYGIGLQKDSELTPKVNAVLKTMKEDGRLAAIYVKWFGTAPATFP